MPPPPAESVASRLFLGPALRTQPDGRLVTLVREGYETAFEEIVRRYGKPLGRYAAAIVGSRAEDVTQDAFSKALLALRRDGAEIELRPWLYRIVRNTALNDLRDRPPSPEALDEAIEGGPSASEAAERREEIGELMTRLRALPEAQRAAIVMRELEGLSHEEIAAALGVSGGAARQAIHRARVTLRDGFGMLVPLPLLRLLIDHGTETAVAGAGGGAAVATGATFAGAGAGGAVKLGAAALLIAGSVGAGVAIHDHSHRGDGSTATSATVSKTAGAASGDSGGDATTAPRDITAAVAPQSKAGEGEHRGSGRRGHGGDDSGSHGQKTQSHDGSDDPSGPALSAGSPHHGGGPGPEPEHETVGEDHHSGPGPHGGHEGSFEPGPGQEGGGSGGGQGSEGGHSGEPSPSGGPPPEESSQGPGGGPGSGSGSSGGGDGSGSTQGPDGGGEESP